MMKFKVKVTYGFGDIYWDLGEEVEYFVGSAEEIKKEYDLDESEWRLILADGLFEDYRWIMIDD